MNDTGKAVSSAITDVVPIDLLPLPYLELDWSGAISRANRRSLDLFGSDQGTLVGRRAWGLMAADEQEESCAAYCTAMETGEAPPVTMQSLFDSSGNFRSYELHRSVIRDGDGKPQGMRVIFVDVTEAQEALEATVAVTAWQENVIDSIGEALIVTDALGFINSANPLAEKLLGYEPGEMIGKAIEDGMPVLSFTSSEAVDPKLSLEIATHHHGVGTVLDRAGEPMELEISTAPVADKVSGIITGVVSVLRPIPHFAPHC
jgi:PAS domain S-box-containing protein